MPKRTLKTEVPQSMQIQLARLFGSQSNPANKSEMSPGEWKSVLKKSLKEIEQYLEQNTISDDLHMMMLYSGLESAKESLKTDNFWPGYVEGVTRLLLVLLGDYPDHRKRMGGRKRKDHYLLNLHRNLHYHQDEDQKIRTLFSAFQCGWYELKCNPQDALSEFREEYGVNGTYKQFFRWYKAKYPEDYATIF